MSARRAAGDPPLRLTDRELVEMLEYALRVRAERDKFSPSGIGHMVDLDRLLGALDELATLRAKVR